MVAYFTYKGKTHNKDKDVVLRQEDDDSFTVTIEDYPALTRTNLSYQEGFDILEGFKGMADKDWGSTEIYHSKRDREDRSRPWFGKGVE